MVVVLGKSDVGKTSLLYKYFYNNFLNNYKPLVEDEFYYCESPYSSIRLVDLAKGENYQRKEDDYIKKAKGILLVFAINDLDSFKSAKKIYSNIKRIRKKRIPILLVGNKLDLKNERQVNEIDGQKFAKSIGGYYIELSAMDDVKIMIDTLADLLLGNIGGGDCTCCWFI